jgi:hypothetical protein
MRRSVSPWIENVEIDPLVAFDRTITPLRLIVATFAVLVASFGVFDRHAQDFLGIGFGDDFWDVDSVASHCGAHARANDDQNSEANHCPSHKILWVKFEAKHDEIAAPHQSSIMRDRRIALCDQESNI